MGFSRKRTGQDGRPRYTAYYLDIRGQERSAGTFGRRKDADAAWMKAEVDVGAGKRGDPSRGRQIPQTYVMEKWLPHHQWEPGVRADYAGQIRRRLLPFFGPMKMRDIMPEQVGQWVTTMQAEGVPARTIQYCKMSILNAIFTTALRDEVVTIHPSRGVKTPRAKMSGELAQQVPVARSDDLRGVDLERRRPGGTVERALDELRAEGYLKTVLGRGLRSRPRPGHCEPGLSPGRTRPVS